MKKVSASEAKTHFGALIDQAQREPVTIEKQGRPVAVILSYGDYAEQVESMPSEQEREQAVQFLEKWSKRPASNDVEKVLKNDLKGQAIWDKYTRKA